MLRNIYTIGHSTMSLDKFISILKNFQIECIADIRSLPGSKRYPHFNKELLELSLSDNHIRYIHMPKLGGRRKTKPDSVNTGWRVAAFRGYADYMETKDFQNAIIELEEIAETRRTAYMCAETLWWRCHRSLVSDYLKLKGWKVEHISGNNNLREHIYTKPARIIDGNLIYR